MQFLWNLLFDIFACGFLFFCWQFFPANKRKDRRLPERRLQRLFTEELFIMIHALLNAYFNPLFQIILETTGKVCFVLLQYIVSCKNQILFTAEPDFLLFQTVIFTEKPLHVITNDITTLSSCPQDLAVLQQTIFDILVCNLRKSQENRNCPVRKKMASEAGKYFTFLWRRDQNWNV